MFQRGSVGASEGAESVGTRGRLAASLPLCLSCVVSAYNPAQQMVRLADEKASFIFPFFGINLSIFGIWGDRILFILGGQVRPAGSVYCP